MTDFCLFILVTRMRAQANFLQERDATTGPVRFAFVTVTGGTDGVGKLVEAGPHTALVVYFASPLGADLRREEAQPDGQITRWNCRTKRPFVTRFRSFSNDSRRNGRQHRRCNSTRG